MKSESLPRVEEKPIETNAPKEKIIEVEEPNKPNNELPGPAVTDINAAVLVSKEKTIEENRESSGEESNISEPNENPNMNNMMNSNAVSQTAENSKDQAVNSWGKCISKGLLDR